MFFLGGFKLEKPWRLSYDFVRGFSFFLLRGRFRYQRWVKRMTMMMKMMMMTMMS